MFVCLPWHSYLLWCGCFLYLPILYGMHLVVPTHPYFFLVVCHPNRTFPQKSLSRNPRIGFLLSPPLDHALLPLTHDLATSCIGWVQASDVWTLHVFHFYVYSKFAYCSCVCRGLEARLHNLPSILDFLWCELFSDFPFFYGLLPLGAGLYLMLGFSFFNPFCSFATFSYRSILPFLL